jgi:maltokinase
MELAALEEWMPRQRWFGGKGRALRIEDLQHLGWLTREPVWSRVVLVTVRYADGEAEVYQVPLVHRDEPVEHLQHVLVGEWTDPESGVHSFVYDALHDKEVTRSWLEHVVTGDDIDALHFHREPRSPDFPVDQPSLVIGAEQSNTSLIYGDEIILKVFRKVSHGINPDIEIHGALARAGSPHIATPLGWVGGVWAHPDTGARGEGSLAMLQTFLRLASEGWELAKASVRDLLAEADLHAEEVGGDFAGESYRLGRATAEVHADLARTLLADTHGREELRRLARDMTRRLDAAAAEVAELAKHADALRKAFDDVAALDVAVPVQRIHGDYHLGQVLRTTTGWVLLDFEGEPAKALEERRALASPLKDIAGMLRSFDYAAHHMIVDQPEPQLRYRAAEWAARNRSAFCDGYAKTNGRDPRDDHVLLRAFEIDKAVYEVMYEARNRPTWLDIPMSAIERLAGAVS